MPAEVKSPERSIVGPLILGGLLVAITLSVHGQVYRYEFLTWDDDLHVSENPHLHPVSWATVRRFWQEPYEGLYIPLSYTYFALEAFVSQALQDAGAGGVFDPCVFHVGNLLLHGACVLLVFAVLRELSGHDGAAFFGACLFGLHPVQVESVSWISEARGLLSAVFSLLAICVYFTAGRKRIVEESGSTRNVSLLLTTLSLFLFLLALLAKPVAVAVPLILFALDRWVLERPLRKTLTVLSGWFGLALLFVIVTKFQQRDATILNLTPPWTRPLIAADAWTFYLYKLLFPWQLAFDYGRTPAVAVQSGLPFYAWLVPVGIVVVVSQLRQRRLWWAALGVFTAGVLPVLGLVPFAYQEISTVADRYLYLAMLGPALLLTVVAAHRWSVATAAVLAVLVFLLAVSSYRQSRTWRNDAVLYTHALTVNPRSYIAHNNLGTNLLRRGEFDAAAEQFRRSLFINPDYADAHYNLGLTLAHLNRLTESADHLREAIRLRDVRNRGIRDPRARIAAGYAQAHFDLGAVLEKQEQLDEALAHYRTALRIRPDFALAHLGAGNIHQRAGRTPQAIEHYHEAIRLKPDFMEARVRLGDALLSEGETAEALTEYEPVLASGHPEVARVHLNVGLVRMREGRLAQAVHHFDEAARTRPDPADTDFPLQLARGYFDLAASLAEARQTAVALDCLRKALRLVPADSKPAEEIQQYIDKYRIRADRTNEAAPSPH